MDISWYIYIYIYIWTYIYIPSGIILYRKDWQTILAMAISPHFWHLHGVLARLWRPWRGIVMMLDILRHSLGPVTSVYRLFTIWRCSIPWWFQNGHLTRNITSAFNTRNMSTTNDKSKNKSWVLREYFIGDMELRMMNHERKIPMTNHDQTWPNKNISPWLHDFGSVNRHINLKCFFWCLVPLPTIMDRVAKYMFHQQWIVFR